ncbi:BRF1 [Lepeophtheirus salmonis]|uniref:BRF1 n=1 Tax=Lepeophtheirus salmonis TaxID=72036 RepID=A0A7R8CJA1_LEPSM|nr:BRF1 [Lepeophtheirus salmonis]CAF2840245.1 BRF1 [Lepeophtheirus salmonis]
MMKCNACGSTEIDVDPSRADAVCTACGQVLESSIIVSDIQFEENSHGGASAIGTFVSSESKGGTARLGIGGFSPGMGLGRESREITLRNARKKIEALSQQLSLRRDRVDMAFHFFKLALSQGSDLSSKYSLFLYFNPIFRYQFHFYFLLLIDDILQIDVYELGRTYLRLSQALCINIPAMDPCLYVMRFAHKLEFGEKKRMKCP